MFFDRPTAASDGRTIGRGGISVRASLSEDRQSVFVDVGRAAGRAGAGCRREVMYKRRRLASPIAVLRFDSGDDFLKDMLLSVVDMYE